MSHEIVRDLAELRSSVATAVGDLSGTNYWGGVAHACFVDRP